MRVIASFALVLALSTTACTKPDDRITKAVQDRLAADQIVHGYHLRVTTDQKVVTIAGVVDTSVAKDQALTVVRTTPGVVDVRDQLGIRDNEATYGWLKKSTGAIGTSGRD